MKNQYCAARVEIQVRGSPHINSFIWILNAPKLTKFNIDEYTKWADSIVRSNLSDSVNEPMLSGLVKTYQIHHHSKICRKYRNEKCRLNFGKFLQLVPLLLNHYKVPSLKILSVQKCNTETQF